ncbi:MAG: 4'-phosphopantetheinyl transferase superfamily protein [Desulfotignum sp.]|nr:4'-phosphopantetheinyl transferase superfamily protein [Desulfotignum sp.]MCF8089607.1 4'-phosphopantetheinyl transferase superfamily protein [Desulfotignum sp.]MCF8139121.1 4'-phosphopantetheinyl transferase superfamily protein [Desulfotignum sp.]
MIKDSQKPAVQTVHFFHGKGPVFYASLPWGPMAGQMPAGPEKNGLGLKQHLISILWDHFVGRQKPFRMHRPYDTPDAFPFQADPFIRVIQGPLGRPQLLLGDHLGPAISFCKSGKTRWAALCGDGHDIGIDVAQSQEFQGKYPFYRVFHPGELGHALKPAGDDLKQAAALLWSVKEAAAKALGCGFHLVDPLQVIVYPSTGRAAGETMGNAAEENSIYDFPVGLSEKAVKRFPMTHGRFLRVRSVYQGNRWLSIALLHRPSQPGDGQHRLVNQFPKIQTGEV